jgi:putative peptidoglycan lipid II flippase
MPHGGLALANTTATLIESLILIILMNRRLNGIDEKRMFGSLMKFLFAGLVMGTVLWQLEANLEIPQPAVRLGLLILSGVGIYLIMILLFRSEELKSFIRLLRRRN